MRLFRLPKSRFFFLLLILGAFAGTICLSRTQDPFKRIEISLVTSDGRPVRGVAILPKPIKPRPLLLFFHGVNGELEDDGVRLRKLAEQGFAVVGIDYDKGDQKVFDEQILAFVKYLHHQPWAETNCVAWLGMSLGAQRTLSFVLKHPEVQPQLLVRLAGGSVPELEGLATTSNVYRPPARVWPKILLIHGDQDEIFPLRDVQKLAQVLKSNQIPVDLRIFSGAGHSFSGQADLVFRLAGEYCQQLFKPGHQPEIKKDFYSVPFLVFFIAPLSWLVSFIFKAFISASSTIRKQDFGSLYFRVAMCLTLALVLAALAETAIQVLVPELKATPATLSLARRFIISSKVREDFDCLSELRIWQSERIKSILLHAELANYNRKLVNWKIPDELYRNYVLSPVIDGVGIKDLRWRRLLWEAFYPQIRKQDDTYSTAQIVVQRLREKVAITNEHSQGTNVEDIWNSHSANHQGFQRIYVAALRSVGVPARFADSGRVEIWSKDKWEVAPQPLISTLTPLAKSSL